MAVSAAISTAQLGFSYGEHQALRGVSFEVPQGSVFGLLGPNGGGKTTLFRLLSTLLPMQSGDATILGFDLKSKPAEIRRHIGITFQSPSIDPRLTVCENLTYQGLLYGITGSELRSRIESVLADLEIADRGHDLTETLSGGLKRRVEIAKSLLHAPKLLLLDEPSTGLDPGARLTLWSLLRSLIESRGVTILVTTHLMDEADRCDRLGILHRGEMIVEGTPGELRQGLGAECVVLETDHPTQLQQELAQMGIVHTQSLPSAVRVETDQGLDVIRRVMQEQPDAVQRATIGRPTLEDVFVHHTGQQFWEDDA